MNKQTKAVGYIKVNNIKQEKEGISLVEKEREIVEYCKKNNINLIKIYIDEGISEKDIEGRNTFKEMFDYVINNDVDTIISFKLSRFTRNIKDFANTIDLLEKNNKSLIFIEDGIDTKSDVGKLMRYVVGAVAEMELKNNSTFKKEG